MIDSSKIDGYWITVENYPVDPLPESRILNPRTRYDDEDIFFYTKLQISITVTGIMASEDLI